MAKQRRRGAAASSIAISIAVLASGSHANETAFDNMGPGNEFLSLGMVVRGPDSGAPWGPFFPIVPQVSGGITEITFPLIHRGDDNLFWFQIYEDSFGQPGTLLAEWIAPNDANAANLPLSITADGSFQIQQGSVYWMGMMPGSNSWGAWLRNAFGDTKDRWAWRGGPGTWTLYPNSNMSALRIMVSSGPTCPPDLNGDGVVDADDFFLFLQLFAAGDMRADFNNDGVIDADDFFVFLNAFAAGC